MSSDDLVRLSVDLSQLTDIARTALTSEIEKRRLRDSPPVLEQANPVTPREKQPPPEELSDWNYQRMSDEELQQLCTAYQKLHQPISDSLRNELDARESRRIQPASITSSPQSHIGPTAQVTPAASVITEATQAVPSAKGASTPYAKFVIQLLMACLCAFVGVFAFFDATARNTSAFGVETLSMVLAVVFGWFGWTTYKTILGIESKCELKSKRLSRKALVTSLIFVVLYMGLAALLGSIIGQNRAEAIQLNFDIEHQKELADRVTKARNSISNSIPSYLAMYTGIESDVNDYFSTLLRLKGELPLYNTKFPNQNETMQKYSGTIEIEIRRCNLLKKQITAAKQIALLDAYQQGPAWRSEMLPLLEEEDSLDRPK